MSVPEAYAKKGLALMNLKQYDKAREALEYVIKNYPPDNAPRPSSRSSG